MFLLLDWVLFVDNLVDLGGNCSAGCVMLVDILLMMVADSFAA